MGLGGSERGAGASLGTSYHISFGGLGYCRGGIKGVALLDISYTVAGKFKASGFDSAGGGCLCASQLDIAGSKGGGVGSDSGRGAGKP